MNEATNTLTRYFGKNDSTTVHYYGSGRGVTQFAELFPEHILDDIRPEDKRDSPDLYMKKDKVILQKTIFYRLPLKRHII